MSQLKSSRTLLVNQEISLFHRRRPRARRPRHDLPVSHTAKHFTHGLQKEKHFMYNTWKALITLYLLFVFLDFSDFILFHKIHEVKIKKVKVIIKKHQNWQYLHCFYTLPWGTQRGTLPTVWPHIPKLNQNKTYTKRRNKWRTAENSFFLLPK